MTSTGSALLVLLVIIQHCLCQYPGDPCHHYSNVRGQCTHLRRCQVALQGLRKNIKPQTCGFDRNEPVVCCPHSANIITPPHPGGGTPPPPPPRPITIRLPTTPITTTAVPKSAPLKKSAQYCEGHFGNVSILNTIHVAVIGGQKSLAQEFPHMAALGYGDENDIQWQCGGSVIGDQHILTAAHCLYSQELGEVRYVRLGDLDLRSSTDDAQPQNYTVINRIAHPNYQPPSQYHDIAILVLDRPILKTKYVKPICLYDSRDLPEYRPVATGWGRTQFGGESSDHLMKVTLQYFSIDECRNTYSTISTRKLSSGIVDDLQICAGGRNEEKDTCQGDSGGPLQTMLGQRLYLLGITSFGKPCGIANSPGIYTRVSYYVPWIEQVVWSGGS